MRFIVEASDTSMETSQGSVTREQVMEMMKQKEGLEEEIRALQEVLKSQGVDMEEPLVDAEGFPRSDIDVYQVRHARSNIRSKVITNSVLYMSSKCLCFCLFLD